MAHATFISIKAEGEGCVERAQQLLFDAIGKPKPATRVQRTRARREASAVINAQPTDYEKIEARSAVAMALCQFIAGLGVGAEFQAPDFNNWLHENQLAPDSSAYEPRCTGAMFRRLVEVGAVEKAGVRTSTGGTHTNYNATPRTVYRVLRKHIAPGLLTATRDELDHALGRHNAPRSLPA